MSEWTLCWALIRCQSITDHELTLHCDRWLVTGTQGDEGPNGNRLVVFDQKYGVTSNGIPTGEMRDVSNSPHDFRKPRVLGEAVAAIAREYPEWPHGDGYVTRKFLECKSNDGTWPSCISEVGELIHPPSGQRMCISSTEPVAQLYFSSLLDNVKGKEGVVYGRHGGLCIEMHRFADSVAVRGSRLYDSKSSQKQQYMENTGHCTLLKAGEKYKHTAIYGFGNIDEHGA